MALTKTQINYLENKLSRVVDERVETYRKELGEGKSADRVIAEKIASGEIKLVTTKELVKKITKHVQDRNHYYYYNYSMNICDMVSDEDKEKVTNEVSERDTKINDFSNKLRDAKQNTLDKIVLEGVDVELAIKELNNITV